MIRISHVAPDSLAARAGISAGDLLLETNGREVRDVLDLRFHAADVFVQLTVKAEDARVFRREFDLSSGAPLGIEVEEFRPKACNNKCIFCFIDQLPRGVRRSLRFKDDDFRLSFLHGNYITLTNLSMEEIDRMVEQRLSPQYVSVHSTDMAIRNLMLGRKDDGGFLAKLLRLVQGGVTVHAQVVLCPTVNDGPSLFRTAHELFDLFPGVISLSVVPLGLSAHRRESPLLVPVTPEYCGQVIEQVAPWQREFRRRSGRTFCYLADEFYLQAGRPLPPASHYDGFELYEDGIGMVRSFHGEFRRNVRTYRRLAGTAAPRYRSGAVLTGKLFHPVLKSLVAELNAQFGTRFRAVPVPNRFLGESVTVAGLLAGQDLQEAARAAEADCVIFPGESLSYEEKFLDGLQRSEIQSQLSVPFLNGGRKASDFFELLFEGRKEGEAAHRYPTPEVESMVGGGRENPPWQ